MRLAKDVEEDNWRWVSSEVRYVWDIECAIRIIASQNSQFEDTNSFHGKLVASRDEI